MDCPGCRSAMIVLELGDVEVDSCVGCGGVWFDAGELELLLRNGGAKDRFLASFKPVVKTRERPRRCPICSKRMEKVSRGPAEFILDRCKKNHGIFCDKREFDGVLCAVDAGEAGQVFDFVKDVFGKKR